MGLRLAGRGRVFFCEAPVGDLVDRNASGLGLEGEVFRVEHSLQTTSSAPSIVMW